MRSSRGSAMMAFLAGTLACGGCGAPLLVQVETTVQPDGSCTRTIWQPEGELLPAAAKSPDWAARWTGIEAVVVPPALRDVAPHPERKYFRAVGVFPSVAAIPDHYERSAPELPGGPSSVFKRAYGRRDLGFVVEHRWEESVTNIVNRADFIRARDELLDRGLPMLDECIDRVYGVDFDVSGLHDYLRRDGRLLLEKAALIYFEINSRHLAEKAATVEFARTARAVGLDLLDAKGSVVDSDEASRRVREYQRHRLVLGVRHRDGSRLTPSEVDAILAPGPGSPYTARAEEYFKTHQDDLKGLLGPMVRMTGLYHSVIPFAPSGASTVRFAFRIQLPGEIVETNGKADGPARASWRFSGDDLYPSGLSMRARSLEIDEASQRLVLGRVAVKGRAEAEALASLLESNESLRALVIRIRETRNPGLLGEHHPAKAEERASFERLRRLLGVEK
ncbi:hypothetical protein [Aquisphaera insulae]|uniref:hypothetical protein n=1 Tax=Aquisphaera insulae TaxID=2712864 RepID=UPI0013EC163E|nr:hypothetical protein [Aquisphaera insulae]